MAGKFKLPLGYSQELECRVLEMPFSHHKDGRISMFLLLPDDPVMGLSRLEANISTENIQQLLSTLNREVRIEEKPTVTKTKCKIMYSRTYFC